MSTAHPISIVDLDEAIRDAIASLERVREVMSRVSEIEPINAGLALVSSYKALSQIVPTHPDCRARKVGTSAKRLTAATIGIDHE